MTYVRRRRLSESALRLQHSNATVLDIAIAAGFGSGEAYSRAFSAQFGVSPAAFRRDAGTHQAALTWKHVMPDDNFNTPAPEFKSLPAFFVVGSRGNFEPGATEAISQHWEAFERRIGDIPNRVGSATYGMCCAPESSTDGNQGFAYVAGVQTDTLDAVPTGLVGLEVPARDYAVFTYAGGIGPTLPRTLQYIFGEWLPESGFEAESPDFEYYDDEFDPATGTGTFYIYVPVRKPSTP